MSTLVRCAAGADSVMSGAPVEETPMLTAPGVQASHSVYTGSTDNCFNVGSNVSEGSKPSL